LVFKLFFSGRGAQFAVGRAQKHLNMHGDNLGNVVQFMERENPKKFGEILKTDCGQNPWR